MGVLSEMLFQMKQNVINNPLAEDVPVEASCNGTIRLGRIFWGLNTLHHQCVCSNRFDLSWSLSGEIFIKHQKMHFSFTTKIVSIDAACKTMFNWLTD